MTYPELEKLKSCIVYLLTRCDGASAIDGQGFNKLDSRFARSLPLEKLSDRQIEAAYKMILKYRKTQLETAGIPFPNKPELEKEIKLRALAKESATSERFYIDLDVEAGEVLVSFDYNQLILDVIKSILPRSHFNREKSVWVFNIEQLYKVLDKLAKFNFRHTDRVKNYLAENRINLEIEKEYIREKIDYVAERLEFNLSCLDKHIVPFKHQWNGIDFILSDSENRGILAHDLGLGKTFTSLLTAKGLQEYFSDMEDTSVSIIVISPASLKSNWVKEAGMLETKIEIYSYAKIPSEPNRDYIVIADECHFAQSYKSNRTKKLTDLVLNDRCKGFIGLSGTPMKNGRPDNLLPLLRMVKHPISKDIKGYQMRYCDAHATAFSQWDVTGAINLQELRQEISDKVQYFRKDQCIDLPEKMFIDVECDSDKNNDDEYSVNLRNMRDDYYSRVEAGEISSQGKTIVFMGQLRKSASLYKCYQAIQMTHELLEQGKSVVIFTEFLESAQRLADRFNVIPFTGETKLEDRTAIVERFQSGKDRVFVGTIKAGGVGLTLTKAQDLIIVDFPWTPGDYQQACDRIHRIGQTGTCSIYNLYGKEIDYVMKNIIDDKNENINQVLKKYNLNKKKSESSGGYYDRVIESILSKVK